jgi:protein-L-isoaspartate(D-aspartate) O-methyltransferase
MAITVGPSTPPSTSNCDAAPDLIPPPLIQQLKAGGKLVIPAGLPDAQTLILVEKPDNGGVTTKEILPVRFSQLENTEAA